MYQLFRLLETFWNINRATSPIFFWHEKFWQRFYDTPYGLPENSRPTIGQRQKFWETARTFQRQKNSCKNRDTPSPLCLKFFDSRNFQKHHRIPLRNFLVLWDNFFRNFLWYPLYGLLNFFVQFWNSCSACYSLRADTLTLYIYVCTLNCRLLSRSDVRLRCLQETCWKGAQAKQICHGYKLFYFAESKNRNGVAIAATEPMNQNIIDVSRINERILTTTFMVIKHGRPIPIISAYTPETGYTECETDKFHECLEDTLLKLDGGVVLAGDLNGHIGKVKNDLNCQGGGAYETMNPEGERILDLAEANSMVILNSLIEKRDEHPITYKSGGKQSQIITSWFLEPHDTT